MESTGPESTHRWGQSRRLTFIDVRLQYDGRINRSDLIDFFAISVPQATADLKRYQELAPGNIAYDPRIRVYVALDTFEPVFAHRTAALYLGDLARLARKMISRSESFVGFIPPTGVVATPARAITPSEVATLVQAIREKVTLKVVYQSMDSPEPSTLTISPHAVGFDGLRWHTRAWCHTRNIFRDFAIGRLKVLEAVPDTDAPAPESDEGWFTHVSVILIPHPDLSPSQRETVMRDYEMENGRAVLDCQKAMLFYTLRHLNLESGELKDAARQHVVVENRHDVDRWVREDRAGIPISA
ncbi:helix-turn-helix transcriptional regulator [Dyella nitratireducens]|uniref:WYL domain-containing protein n=1 Tax=Dyella nitratireducens TaxID=1849580 RepID=A0ABQ1GC83_9GAMM|nr:WYL domain-containing protein [Dyella nitratireducens]GGA40806.1 hypothetical protein GCM10010981_32530 [Dyella nitratireducens]GLQ40611.1 hypothetical protein GCM10007902_04600 [Dyella nitratireducens]